MQLGSFLASSETMYSPRYIEPWVVRSVESCVNLVSLCLLTFQRWYNDLEIPRRSWLTSGNPPCGWARATSRTSIWSEPTKELKTREAYDDSPSTAGQKRNLRAVVETPQKSKSMTVDIPPAAEPLAPPPAAPEVPEDEKEEPTEKPDRDE